MFSEKRSSITLSCFTDNYRIRMTALMAADVFYMMESNSMTGTFAVSLAAILQRPTKKATLLGQILCSEVLRRNVSW